MTIMKFHELLNEFFKVFSFVEINIYYFSNLLILFLVKTKLARISTAYQIKIFLETNG